MNNLSVALFNTSANSGGAGKACKRLFNGLSHLNTIDITYYVKYLNNEKNHNIIKLQNQNNIKEQEYINHYYIPQNRSDLSNTHFSCNLSDIDKNSFRNYSIINLHWIDEFISYNNLHDLAQLNIPIVWTLHDMKPFTAGCHYSSGCQKYFEECQECPQLKQDPKDLVSKVFKIKKRIFESANITVVSPSEWLSQEARKSKLFSNKRIEVIPNSINTEIFKPLDKKDAREYFKLDSDVFILAFGVVNHSEKRKGFEYLLNILHILSKKRLSKKVVGLTFGKSSNVTLPIPTINIGEINEEKVLNRVYNAIDVFLLTSLEDNLPNTILESFATGTPVVAFDTGGISDLVQEQTGCLVEAFNTEMYVNAVIELLEDNKSYTNKSKNALTLIQNNYQLHHQAEKYAKLFKELSNNTYISNKSKKPDFEMLVDEKTSYFSGFSIDNYDFAIKFNKLLEQTIFLKNHTDKIILYGNGNITKMLMTLYPSNNFIVVDINSSNKMYDKSNKSVLHPIVLKDIDYDCIFITVLGREEEIILYLTEKLNIKKDKIRYFKLTKD